MSSYICRLQISAPLDDKLTTQDARLSYSAAWLSGWAATHCMKIT